MASMLRAGLRAGQGRRLSRMLDIADGSDMMGSLRNPAGWNNVYSMRPSWGLVPSEPEGDVYSATLSTAGPMGRTPRDVARLFDVMAGPAPGQPLSRPHQLVTPMLEGARLDGITFGLLGDWSGAFPMEDGVYECVHQAASRLAKAGSKIVGCPPSIRKKIWTAWTAFGRWPSRDTSALRRRARGR